MLKRVEITHRIIMAGRRDSFIWIQRESYIELEFGAHSLEKHLLQFVQGQSQFVTVNPFTSKDNV